MMGEKVQVGAVCEEEEEEVIEWVDHSNATALEEFVAAVEQLLAQWGVAERGSALVEEQEQSAVKTAELQLGKDVYSVMLVPAKVGCVSDGDDAGQNGTDEEENEVASRITPVETKMLTSFTEFGVWEDRDTWPSNSDIHKWFGIDSYILMQPLERAANLNDVSLLLSSASLAFSVEGNPPLPCFIATHYERSPSPSNRAIRGPRILKRAVEATTKRSRMTEGLFGVCVSGLDVSGMTIHFNATVEDTNKVKANHQLHLSGLLSLFKSKLGPEDQESFQRSLEDDSSPGTPSGQEKLEHSLRELANGNILVTVQFSYLNRPINHNRALLSTCSEEAYFQSLHWTEWHDDDLTWRLHIKAAPHPTLRRVISALQGGMDHPPLWGPLNDPIKNMDLQVLWPSFRESTYAENSMFSSLVPESAPKWILSAFPGLGDEIHSGNGTMHLDYKAKLASSDILLLEESSAICPLSRTVRFIFQLLQSASSTPFRTALIGDIANAPLGPGVESDDADSDEPSAPAYHDNLNSGPGKDKKVVSKVIENVFQLLQDQELDQSVLKQIKELKALYMDGSLEHAEFRDALQRIVEDAEGNIPDELHLGGKQTKAHSDSHFNVLRRPCPECWICSSQSDRVPHSTGHRKLKTAPVGSILSILALRAMPEFGASIEGFALLWSQFVSELRWHWDSLVLVPINQTAQDPNEDFAFRSVNHDDCLIFQKLTLLNLCIATEAHTRFSHDSFPDRYSVGQNKKGANDGEESNASSSSEAEDEEDVFYDANSADESGGQPQAYSVSTDFEGKSQLLELVNPWTLENAIMTEDMVAETNELMESLALTASSASLHEKLLSDSLRSEMRAFKAANTGKKFEDFKRWKGRSRRLGEFWRKLWDACDPLPLKDQLQNQPQLFNASQEAEKLLLYLETLTPLEVLSQLLGIALEGAEFLLSSAVGGLAIIPEVYPVLHKQVLSIRSQLERIYGSSSRKRSQTAVSPRSADATAQTETQLLRAQQGAVLDTVRRAEYLLTISTSLLHKLPAKTVSSMLTEMEISGNLCCTLDNSQRTERTHIRALLFPGSADDSLAMPEPQQKEYLFRSLTSRSSYQQPNVDKVPDFFQKFSMEVNSDHEEETIEDEKDNDSCVGDFMELTRPGANRMYVSVTKSFVTIASALTETSFP